MWRCCHVAHGTWWLDAEWEWLRPLLPEGGQRGGRWNDRRQTINGVLYRARTGLPWRDFPQRFGPWITVYKRHRRWSADGTWQMLLTAIQAGQDAEGRLDGDIAVDSTMVRAHQHAAGAPRTPPSPPAAPGRQKGDAVRTNRGDPVLATLAARLAEVVRLGSA
ncbi:MULTISPECIES: IS5 family transposase [unclassified Nonomuraea]|uniref:IS5 family transposase n=1 Tax=unclassified Nonomuraea TaxID=2593643 RepID=UPI0033C5C261